MHGQQQPWNASATSVPTSFLVSDGIAVVFHRAVTPFVCSCTPRVSSVLLSPIHTPVADAPRCGGAVSPCVSRWSPRVGDGVILRYTLLANRYTLAWTTSRRAARLATRLLRICASKETSWKQNSCLGRSACEKSSEPIDPTTRECEPTGSDGVFFCCFGCGR